MSIFKMNPQILEWLLSGPLWIRYAVEFQLLGKKPDVQMVLKDNQFLHIIKRLKDNHIGIPALQKGKVSYASTGNAYWDLFFLTDIGLNATDLGINDEMELIFKLQRPDKMFITEQYNKPNYFCISSILISSVAKMGLGSDKRLLEHINIILDSQRIDGGWHCALSRAKGKRLQDTESCPMDNLNILMFLGQYEQFRNDPRLHGAIDLLLNHWERKNEKYRPYGFGTGTDYSRLRYPAVKYNILRVLDVLSLYPYALKSETFGNMLNFVQQKAIDGKFYAESVSKSYSEFDFGQKKEPSRWITFLISRIIKAGFI